MSQIFSILTDQANTWVRYEPFIVLHHTCAMCVACCVDTLTCLMISVGLVAYDGEDKDMAPPATIYTKVHVQMIRIVRKDFHSRIAQYAAAL